MFPVFGCVVVREEDLAFLASLTMTDFYDHLLAARETRQVWNSKFFQR